jgi:hypothetical protein
LTRRLPVLTTEFAGATDIARQGATMSSLRDQLTSAAQRNRLIDDAERVLDQEVAVKGGLGGMAVKAGYKLVKSVKPGFVRDVIDSLLDEFLDALDPVYQEALAKQEPPGRYLERDAGRVADALLAITDLRAQRSRHTSIKVMYEKLRPAARKHVEAAAPRLGRLLETYAAN